MALLGIILLSAENQEFRIAFLKVLEPAVVADSNSELQQLRKFGELGAHR